MVPALPDRRFPVCRICGVTAQEYSIYEYMVNGQRYEYHTRLGSSIDQYPVGKEYPGYYDPENPKDVTETLKDITGGGSHFLSLICFVIGGVAILLGLVRVWSVITLL